MSPLMNLKSMYIIVCVLMWINAIMSKLSCDGVRVAMKGQTMSIPLDTCTISQGKDGYESYTYSCDKDKQFFWV